MAQLISRRHLQASWFVGAWLSCAATLTGCGDATVTADGTSAGIVSAPLTGTRAAIAGGDYPSVVGVLQMPLANGYLFHTTAVKVGPRHFAMVAERTEGDAAQYMTAGSPLRLTTRRQDNGLPTHEPSIQNVHVPAQYAACAPNCNKLEVPAIAIVVVSSDTPDIPQATVDLSPVQYGESLVKLGYTSLADCGTVLQMQLAAGASRAERDTAANVAGNVLAAGAGKDATFASYGCGNDGPIFRGGSPQSWFVGIMSERSGGSGQPGSLSGWDAHSRLDASARVRVASWLESFGVNVGHSRTSPSAFKGDAAAIPGTIEAEDYDFGDPEVAYHDTSPENFPSAWYRVEGVDLDQTDDEGGGYNIGGTEAGEWTAYSMVASTTGNFTLELRVASVSEGKQLHLEIDGKDVSGPVMVPNTQDWQQYQTVSAPSIQLESGKHELRVVFDTGGVNLNWIRFATCAEACNPSQGTAGTGGMSTTGTTGGVTSSNAGAGSAGLQAGGSAGSVTSAGSGGSNLSAGGTASGGHATFSSAGSGAQATPGAGDSSGCALAAPRSGNSNLIGVLWLLGAAALLRKRCAH